MKNKIIKTLVVYILKPAPQALAAQGGSEDVNLLLSTVGVTLAVALSIFALAKFIKYISSVKTASPLPVESAPAEEGQGGLEEALSRELADPSASKEQNEAAIRAAKQIFSKELTKRVEGVTKEMNNKFQAAIKEKNLEYSAIDRKYKETLGDKKQTESVLRSIAEGLVVLNDKGEVMMLNPAAERILGVSAKKQVGTSMKDNIKEEQLMSLVKKKEGAKGKEVEVTVKDEDIKKTIKSSSAVIEDDKGQTIGMVSVLTDVTKQKELDALKSKFFSSVSHELRSPIVAIRNSIALILDKRMGKLNDEQEKIVKVADRNLKRLRLLVDDILDFSKLEAKKIELNPVPSSIGRAVNETCDTFDNWARSREIKIVRSIEKDIPEVKFDPDRIMQVLSNIMSNSIKFTPKGGTITVGAALSVSGEQKEIVVSIKDTGPGIAAEDIPKLFNQYQQVGEGPSKTDIKGTGLGLYISKELVELHKGRIWIESDLGKGAKFIFTIPFKSKGGKA
jgi:NtrC-family two-component system sensor histidine kinase KinB